MKKIIYTLLFSIALVSCGGGEDPNAFKMVSTEDADISGDHFWYFEIVGSNVPLRLTSNEDGTQLTPEVDVTLKLVESVNFPEDVILACPDMRVSMVYESTQQGTFSGVKITEESQAALSEMLKSGKKGKVKLTFVAQEPIEAVKAEAIATQVCDFNIYDASFDTSEASSDDLFDAIFPDSSWNDVCDELEESMEKALELYEKARSSFSDSDANRYCKQSAKVDLLLAKVEAAGGEDKIENNTSLVKLIEEYYKLW